MSRLNKVSNNSREIDSLVNKIKSAISSSIKGDNTQGFISKVGEVNKNCNSNIITAIRKANNLIQKIEKQIKDIDKQIRDIEAEEARQRAEDARKKEEEKRKKELANKS